MKSDIRFIPGGAARIGRLRDQGLGLGAAHRQPPGHQQLVEARFQVILILVF